MADQTPTMGVLEGGVHRVPFRIYYEDTDTGNVVYHANYLRYMERGRTDYLRHIDVELEDLMSNPDKALFFVVRSIEIDFLSSARLDDAILVETWMKAVSGAKIEMGQIVKSGERILTKASVKAAITNHKGRPQRFPKEMWARMTEMIVNHGE
jgi:acyl-CoA thioester hydrolase